MESVDVPVGLLGYGTVGSAVDRLLTEGADEIEFLTIAEPAEALQQDLEAIRGSNLIPPSVEISSHVFDLNAV